MNSLPDITPQKALMPSTSEWSMIKEQARLAIQSQFLPASIKTAEQAITIALKGRELGIPMMQAFAHINVIQGKPAISAELMLALIYKNCPGAVVNFITTSNETCVIEAKRPGGKVTQFTFSMDDAAKAGVLGKDSWRKYPAAMLRARCVSAMARAIFPDALMGCSYVPEELGAEVEVRDDGGIVVAENTAPIKAKDVTPAKDPQVEAHQKAAKQAFKVKMSLAELKEYQIPLGKKYINQTLGSVPEDEIRSFLEWLYKQPKHSPQATDFIAHAEAYLEALDDEQLGHITL